MGKSKELATFTDAGGTISGDLTLTERLEVNTSTNPFSSFPSGNWAGKIYNNLDASNEGGLVVANRWAAGTSTALLVGGLFDAGDGFDEFLKVDGVGRVTMPYQPAFYAYNLNFPYQTAGAAVGGSVMTNIGSGYNGTTGRFTAPVTGTYVIHVMTQYYSDGSQTYQTAAIYKNGTSIGAESWHGNSGSTGNYHTQANTCVIVTLNANDYVQAYTYYGSRDIQNFFCGYLIG